MSDVVIKRSGVHGVGVFAAREFAPGEMIWQMGGRKLSLLGCIRDMMHQRINIDDPLQIGPHHYLDLDPISIRFNHSCEANAALRGEHELFALHAIPRGSEITFDYAMTVVPSFYSWAWDMPCSCGSERCRKQVGDIASVPPVQLAQYRAQGALQDYLAANPRFLDVRILIGRALRSVAKPVKTAGHAASNMFARWGARLTGPSDVPRSTIRDHSYVLPGGRTGVLLIHGLSGTPVEMRDVADGLHAKGFTVSCPQLAGHCGTFDDLKESTWEEWADSAEKALDELRTTCSTIVVGGLSTGAILSLHLAAKRPDAVDGTMLYAPTLWLNGWVIPPHAYLFRIVLQKWVANFFDHPDLPPHGIKDPAIRARVAAAINSGDPSLAGLPVTPGGSVLEQRWLVNSVRRRLNLVTQPALIVHPREDDYADLNNISFLLRHLPCEVETLTLNDSYHIITTDRQRHRVIEQSLQFIDRVATGVEQQRSSRSQASDTADRLRRAG